MTQNQQVIEFIKEHGSITTWDAIINLHITRLSGRINELGNKGLDIPRQKEDVIRTDGTRTTITRYWLSDDDKKRLEEGDVIV